MCMYVYIHTHVYAYMSIQLIVYRMRMLVSEYAIVCVHTYMFKCK
jgi:hypothetical protein